MMPVELAAVLKLGPSDRETWIAHFLDDRGAALASNSVANVAFPPLFRDHTPADYLVESFKLGEHEQGQRDCLRTAVVSLIRTECDQHKVSHPDNVLGHLLRIACDCGFTEIIEEKLWGWICADAYSEATCWDGRQTVSLRTLTWSALLTWDLKREWLEKLVRDAGRPDCGALCFRRIAQLDPLRALRSLPQILTLQTTYWRTLVHELIETMGIDAALGSDMHDAWRSCLSKVACGKESTYLLLPIGFPESEEDEVLATGLWRALNEVGIRLERHADKIRLRKKGTSALLDVDLDLPDPVVQAQARAERMNDDFKMPERALYAKYLLASTWVGNGD